jgi:hypothetical protein
MTSFSCRGLVTFQNGRRICRWKGLFPYVAFYFPTHTHTVFIFKLSTLCFSCLVSSSTYRWCRHGVIYISSCSMKHWTTKAIHLKQTTKQSYTSEVLRAETRLVFSGVMWWDFYIFLFTPLLPPSLSPVRLPFLSPIPFTPGYPGYYQTENEKDRWPGIDQLLITFLYLEFWLHVQ